MLGLRGALLLLLAGLAISANDNISSYEKTLSNGRQGYPRFRRNVDPLSDYSHKLSTVARISNGISVLSGLISSKIAIDDVIAELLNFGPLKVKDVVGIDTKKLDAFISKLEAAETSIDQSDDVIDLERELQAMASLKAAYVSDFSKFKEPTEYFDQVHQFFLKDLTTFDSFKKVLNQVNEVLNAISKLESVEDFEKVQFFVVATDLVRMGDGLSALSTEVSSINPVIATFDSFGLVSTGDEILKPLKAFIGILEAHRNISFTSIGQDLLGANLQFVSELSTLLDDSLSELAKMESLVTARIQPHRTPRQTTPGFIDGAVSWKMLSADIRDPSVETVLGAGKNYQRVADGLKPLNNFSTSIDTVERKLSSISSSPVLSSLSYVVQLQKSLRSLKVTKNDVLQVVGGFTSCKFIPVYAKQTETVGKQLERIEKLTSEFSSLKSTIMSASLSADILKDIQKLIILVAIPVNPNQDIVRGVYNKFKSEAELVKRVSDYLTNMKNTLQSPPNATEAKEAARKVLAGKLSIQMFLDMQEVLGAINGLNSLRDVKGPVDSVQQGMKLSDIVKKVDTKSIADVKLAIETISREAGVIEDLLLTAVGSMKSAETPDVTKLISLPNVQKITETMSSTARSIRDMEKLQGLEKTVKALQGSTVVDTELGKIQDPTKKDAILKKWGDQKAFLDSLDTGIQQIKVFKAQLKGYNLRELGAPLDEAKKVGDVATGILDKLEAIDLLLLGTTDAQVTKDLGDVKAHLNSLAPLDLQFSNHHSTFPGVTDALKSLFDFFLDFVEPPKPVTVVMIPPSPQPQGVTSGAASGAASGRAIVLPATLPSTATQTAIIGAGAAVGVLLLGAIAFGVWYWNYNRKKTWAQIQYWINKIYFADVPSAIGFARGLKNVMDKEVKKQKAKPTEKKCDRYSDIPVIKATAVTLPDGRYINANWIKALSGARFIATQGPLAEKKDPNGQISKLDTRLDFLYMIMEFDVEYVIQLCNYDEIDKYARDAKGNHVIKSKSARYAPEEVGASMVIGQYKVTTDSVEYALGCALRKLTIVDTKSKKTHKTLHMHHRHWDDKSIPESVKDVVKILRKVNQSKRPIVVHCSAGVGRTVSLIGAEVIARDVERHPKKSTEKMFMKLREVRHKGMQTAQQAYFSVRCAHWLLLQEYAPDDKAALRQYEEHDEIFQLARVKMAKEDDSEMRRVNGLASNEKADETKKSAVVASAVPETLKSSDAPKQAEYMNIDMLQ